MQLLVVPAWQAAAPWLTAVAIIAALESVLRRARAAGADRHLVFDTAIVALLVGLLAGHALYLALHGAAHPGDWLRFWGEQSVFGLLAGGTVAALAWLRYQRAAPLAVADLAAPGLALAYAIARTGCFLNGDDFGIASGGLPGVAYQPGTDAWLAHAAAGWIPPDAPLSLPVLPVQLLSAAFALVAFAVLRRVRLPPGGAAALAAIMYGAFRVLTEPLRHDFAPILAGLALPQLLGLVSVAAGALLLRRAARTAPRPQGRARLRPRASATP